MVSVCTRGGVSRLGSRRFQYTRARLCVLCVCVCVCVCVRVCGGGVSSGGSSSPRDVERRARTPVQRILGGTTASGLFQSRRSVCYGGDERARTAGRALYPRRCSGSLSPSINQRVHEPRTLERMTLYKRSVRISFLSGT